MNAADEKKPRMAYGGLGTSQPDMVEIFTNLGPYGAKPPAPNQKCKRKRKSTLEWVCEQMGWGMKKQGFQTSKIYHHRDGK